MAVGRHNNRCMLVVVFGLACTVFFLVGSINTHNRRYRGHHLHFDPPTQHGRPMKDSAAAVLTSSSTTALSSTSGDTTTAAKIETQSTLSSSSTTTTVVGAVGDEQQAKAEPKFEIRVLREDNPKILYIENALSYEDCDTLVRLAKANMEASSVVGADGGSVYSEVRTSKGTFLQEPDQMANPVVINFRKRLSSVVPVPVENLEHTQILHYAKGQFYRPHYDWFDSSLTETLKRGGQRVASSLTWLTDVEEGGATTFPEVNVTIYPKKSNAIVWWNVDENNNGAANALHGGDPPIKGDKWVAVLWMHEREFT
eukprot:TRINITY_DN2124_c0_g1_i1.p1 TRINITY_DN2124_c0_g1~~TRINITY_DN2124_c0_g1_i1.p1  ORF type:complete len:312 (+),score=54.15 TRINITY_DN2124_c0_g1_i1:213-1148(+)